MINAQIVITVYYYRWIIGLIIKNEAINIMQNANLNQKSGTLESINNYYHV